MSPLLPCAKSQHITRVVVLGGGGFTAFDALIIADLDTQAANPSYDPVLHTSKRTALFFTEELSIVSSLKPS